MAESIDGSQGPQPLRSLSKIADLEGFLAGVAVCFDNAFDDPFTTPLRRGPVDLFVVVRNEACEKKTDFVVPHGARFI